MSEEEMKEFTSVGKITNATLGVVDNCYKHALHLTITFDYEKSGVQSFGRDYITTFPLRAVLEMFSVTKLDRLVGRFAYVIREGTNEWDAMITGFYPMVTENHLDKEFRAADWYGIEKAAVEAVKGMVENE